MDFDPNKPPIYYRSLRRRRARSSRIAYPILFLIVVVASLAVIAINRPPQPAQSMALLEEMNPLAPAPTQAGGIVIPTLTPHPVAEASATLPPLPVLPSLTPTAATYFQADPRGAQAHCGKTVVYGTVSEGIYGVNHVWVRVWWPDGSLPQNWQAETGSNALWGNGGYEIVLSELPIQGTWYISIVDGDGKPVGDIYPVETTSNGCDDGTGRQIVNINFRRQGGTLGELALLPTPTAVVPPTVAPPPPTAPAAPPPTANVANPLPPLVIDGTGRSVRVPILMYHYLSVPPPGSDAIRQGLSVGPDVFRAQLVTLREQGYTSITLTELAYAIAMGNPLPPKPVVITFDDGYRDNYTNAFPILKEEGFKATFFIITNLAEERNDTYMTWEMLVEMQQAGMEIGSHTLSHIDLSGGRTEGRIRQELVNSRELLQQRLGVEIRTLAYPYGGYDSGVAELARQAGYWIAVTTEGGVVHSQNDMMTASRVRVQSGMFPGRLLNLMEDCSVYKEC